MMVLPAYDTLSAYKILNQVKPRPPVGASGRSLERTMQHKNQPGFTLELRARREHTTTTDSIPSTAHNKTAGDKVEHIGEHRGCWIAYRACGYVVMRIRSCVDMRVCEYAARRYKIIVL